MFSSKESLYQRHLTRNKENLYKFLTKQAMPLFLRGKDAISIGPQVSGFHEKRIYDLVKYYAETGLNDFFIDIGANIGLSSCQSGNEFKEIHCFEPNPNCYSILSINTKLALHKPQIFLNAYGLGEKEEYLELMVPKTNWGGGFINDKNNSYSEEQLLSKDGTNSFNSFEYEKISISVKSAKSELTNLFNNLQSKGYTKGFIKIDVEGYEPLIIKAISETIPKQFEVVILFECFDKTANPTPLFNQKENINIYKLVRSPQKSMSKLKRIIKIIKSGYEYKLEKFNPQSNSSDIVIHLKT
jgi:FkbM family methyltransferase